MESGGEENLTVVEALVSVVMGVTATATSFLLRLPAVRAGERTLTLLPAR
jgi:hypothetical protein